MSLDPELEHLKQEIGAKEFNRLYHNMYMHAMQSKKRYSGRKYTNSPERIQAIKEKYKNGVTGEILDEFIKSL